MDGDLLAVRQHIEALERGLAESDPPTTGGAVRTILRELRAIADELRRREMTLEARRQAFETERQRAVNPSEERFESAFAYAPIGIGLVGVDGRAFQVNRALCEMFGYTEAEVLSGAVVDASGAGEIERAFASSRQLLREERRSFQLEKRFRHKDGHFVEALLSVSLVGGRADQPPYFICQLVDLGERKRAEAALRASEERFRALVENALDVVSLLDAEGRLLYNTPNVTRVFGYDAGNAVGRAVMLEGVHREDTGRAQRMFLEALQNPGRPVTAELRVRRADGAWLWVEGTACNMLDNPHVQAIVVNSRDVTDRRRAEEAAHQRQAELAQVLRVHTMGEMAAGLAHEINQPLAAIVNYARGCVRRLEEQPTPADVLQVLGQITEEGLRAAAIVRGLRRFLRKGPPRHAWEDLNAVVVEALRFSAADARQRGIVLTRDLAGEMPSVQIDRVQIEQVLVNLIRNGLEAMGDGAGSRRELSVHTAIHGDDSLAIAVRDGGSGVPADIAERIFDPFFTTKPSGLGMGLAISRSIVHAHGGEIWAAPNADGGTTVSFTIPLQRSADSDRAAAARG